MRAQIAIGMLLLTSAGLACIDEPGRPNAEGSGGLETSTSDPSSSSNSTLPDMSTGGDGDGDGSGDGDGDGDGSGDGDGDPSACDPTPSSWDPWIGGPCVDDLDCAYDGGVCLREDEGWPCGTCSQPCDMYCPDIDGAPETFCANQDLTDPFGPDQGACLQKCDPSMLPNGGCRPGYTCTLAERQNDPGTWAAVCMPPEYATPKSACQQTLDDLGMLWVPAYLPVAHPATHPNLDCIVEDPVRLYSPINGVDYRYISFEDPTPLLVSCDLALALHEFGDLLQLANATEVAHIGTYNCRVINGTDTLSQHAFGYAIDFGGFTLDGGQYLTVFDDWEDNVLMPVTPEGQWLRNLTNQAFAQMIFNIILTPDYNAAHDDHFHVDLTPGSSFYE